MKNLIISFVSVIVLCIIGCQENSITDPLGVEPSNKVQSGTHNTNFQGIIPLQRVLYDPHPVGNSFYQICGQIEYDFNMFYLESVPPISQRRISIRFEVSADLQYFCTLYPNSYEDNLAGFISEVSEDLIPLGGNFVSLLEKTFTVQGREDGMVLKANFSVAYNSIELNAVWLALPNANTEAIVINQY